MKFYFMYFSKNVNTNISIKTEEKMMNYTMNNDINYIVTSN